MARTKAAVRLLAQQSNKDTLSTPQRPPRSITCPGAPLQNRIMPSLFCNTESTPKPVSAAKRVRHDFEKSHDDQHWDEMVDRALKSCTEDGLSAPPPTDDDRACRVAGCTCELDDSDSFSDSSSSCEGAASEDTQ